MANRNQLHAVRLQRHNHLVDLVGAVGAAHHVRNGMAVNISVNHADLESSSLQGHRQVHRDGGLTYAALSGRHRVHTCRRIRLCEGDHRIRSITANHLADFAALLIAHHIGGDGDVADSGHAGGCFAGLFCQMALHRAASNGQINFDGNVGAINIDGLNHAKLGDGAIQLWILDLGQRAANIRFLNC